MYLSIIAGINHYV